MTRIFEWLISSNLKSFWVCGLTKNQATTPLFICWANEVAPLVLINMALRC
jgi:hypothetical protein